MFPNSVNNQIITHKNHHELFKDFNSDNSAAQIDETKRISYKIKKIIFRILGTADSWIAPPEKIDGNNVKRVIIFRQDGIGDYIVSTPVIGWLKSALLNVEIDVLTSFRNDFVVRDDPNVNSTYPIHHKKILHPATFKIFKLRKKKYDVIIALDYTRTTYSALLARIIAPKAEKITVMHPTRKEIYGLVFNRQTKIEGGSTHWSQNMLKFVTENIEPVNNPDKKSFLQYFPVKDYVGKDISHIFQKHDSGAGYCIVNISAFTERNQLSLDTIQKVCKGLSEKINKMLIFVTGSPDDYLDIEKVVNNVNKPNCLELKLKLSEFAVFLAGAKFIISPDTATIHIAAALGVPVVGIYSWFESARAWYPFNVPFSIVLSNDNQAVNSIEPSRILEATEILVNCLEFESKT
jgi:ADP-heptose:LPS heptosyltransferase